MLTTMKHAKEKDPDRKTCRPQALAEAKQVTNEARALMMCRMVMVTRQRKGQGITVVV